MKGEAACSSSASAKIKVARTTAQIARCHEVMHELRPQFRKRQQFVECVRRQQGDGYLMAYLESAGEVRSVAGYRILESLFSGRFLYVDDLVTRELDRSSGYGGALFDWLVRRAREHGCEHLELDSGVHRFAAHRFYFVRQMKISSYHFTLPLNPTTAPKKRRPAS